MPFRKIKVIVFLLYLAGPGPLALPLLALCACFPPRRSRSITAAPEGTTVALD